MPIPRINRWLGAALLCGALPLTAGILIFLTWLVTRWGLLQTAGFLIVLAGWPLLLMGSFCLVGYVVSSIRSQAESKSRIILKSLGAAAFLLINIPTAAAIISTVISIEARYAVTIVNEGSEPLDRVYIEGGGIREDMGTIPPGGEARRTFHIRHDGTLMFRAACGDRRFEKVVDGYVTNGIGGSRKIMVTREGVGVVEMPPQ